MAGMVSIHERGALIVMCYSDTPAGYGLINDGYVILPRDASAEQIGDAVLHASLRCQDEVSASSRRDDPHRALLNELGLSGHHEYMRDAKAVHAHFSDELKIIPTRNAGPDGFCEIPDCAAIIDDPNPSEIGGAV